MSNTARKQRRKGRREMQGKKNNKANVPQQEIFIKEKRPPQYTRSVLGYRKLHITNVPQHSKVRTLNILLNNYNSFKYNNTLV